MIVSHRGDRVRIFATPVHDIAFIEKAVKRYADALEEHGRYRGFSHTEIPQSVIDEVGLAEWDFEEIFTSELTIQAAENFRRKLSQAIIRAKAAQGRFNRGDD